MIRSGTARRVLLITAETYSKYIDPTDRSLRTIFGDGAAATLVEASDVPSLGGFVFGTDGSGGDMLLVAEGGAAPKRRHPTAETPTLAQQSLHGRAGTGQVQPRYRPAADRQRSGPRQWTRDQIDMYLIHQATLFMLDHLRERLSLDREHTPEALENYGNTVSSTIPILIRDLRESGRLRPGKQTLLMGFGVGLSWAGCVWTETWAAQQVQVETIAEKSAEKPIEPPGDPPSDTQRRSDNASADSREAA